MITIEELLDEKLLLLDFEYGNTRGTFNAINTFGYNQSIYHDNKLYLSNIFNEELLLTENRKLLYNKFFRELSFKPLCQLSLYDMVSRFIIYTKSNKPAFINSNKINHKCSNHYYQETAGKISIPLNDNLNLMFINENHNKNNLFENVMYVRDVKSDYPNYYKWIIHHRLIALSNEYVLMSCNRFFSGKFFFNSLIPNRIKRKFYRYREEHKPDYPFQSIRLSMLDKSNIFSIKTNLLIV